MVRSNAFQLCFDPKDSSTKSKHSKDDESFWSEEHSRDDFSDDCDCEFNVHNSIDIPESSWTGQCFLYRAVTRTTLAMAPTTFKIVLWVKNSRIKIVAIENERIADWIGSGMLFILVPAVGDDHVCGWVATVWSNDWYSSVVPHVAVKVWDAGPQYYRTNIPYFHGNMRNYTGVPIVAPSACHPRTNVIIPNSWN